jgi:hypothetical protein
MAVAVVTKSYPDEVFGRRSAGLYTVTLDTSYPSPGGYAFDPKAFGFVGVVQHVLISPRFAAGATGTLTRQFQYDQVNKKIVAIVTSTGVEVANAVDVSGCVLDITVIGD